MIVDDIKSLLENHGYHQAVLVVRRVGDSGEETVVTAGADTPHSEVAARVGNFLKRQIMSWPEQPLDPSSTEVLQLLLATVNRHNENVKNLCNLQSGGQKRSCAHTFSVGNHDKDKPCGRCPYEAFYIRIPDELKGKIDG